MKRSLLLLSLIPLLSNCAAPGGGGSGKELSPEARAAIAAVIDVGVNTAGQYAKDALAKSLKVTPAK